MVLTSSLHHLRIDRDAFGLKSNEGFFSFFHFLFRAHPAGCPNLMIFLLYGALTLHIHHQEYWFCQEATLRFLCSLKITKSNQTVQKKHTWVTQYRHPLSRKRQAIGARGPGERHRRSKWTGACVSARVLPEPCLYSLISIGEGPCALGRTMGQERGVFFALMGLTRSKPVLYWWGVLRSCFNF